MSKKEFEEHEAEFGYYNKDQYKDLISEFVNDLKHKQYFWTVYRNQIIKKWEEKL